ncbi:hypothetical protein M407DRAFT_28629, partial [Tulasnella calospora MUT 4182]
LVAGGNSTIRSADDLPSATFTPSPGIFPVNVLFSLSLTLAIISSFLAVLGQQWLVYYRKRSGGGAEYQRWEQLRRYLGAQRWRMELILDDVLPALLQLALVIFCVAFVLYLRTLSKTIYYVITTPMAAALAILFLIAVAASSDQWCPFKSPLSHLVQSSGQAFSRHKLVQAFKWEFDKEGLLYGIIIIPLAVVFVLPSILIAYLALLAIRLIRNAKTFLVHRLWNRSQSSPELLSLGGDVWVEAWKVYNAIENIIDGLPRPGEGIAQLRAVAAKRVLCTSEDFNALIYTGINLLAIKEKESARHFLEDDAVHDRLDELMGNSEKMLVTVFTHAYTYILWGGESAKLFVAHRHHQLYSSAALFPRMPEYIMSDHPLQEKVKTVISHLARAESFGADGTSVQGLWLPYLEVLDFMLNDEPEYSRLMQSQFGHVTEGQQDSESLAPLWIWLVAKAVSVGNKQIEPTPRYTRRGVMLFILREKELSDQERERYLTVEQQRVETVKDLASRVGWEMQSFPADREAKVWSDTCSVIQDAFHTYNSQSPRARGKEDVWLLEQALFISIKQGYRDGFEFVAENCIDLLCTFDESQDTVSNPVRPGDYRKDNRVRCTKALSRCFRAALDTYLPCLRNILSEILEKLVERLEWLVNDLTPSPSSSDVSMLSSWLEIRDTLFEGQRKAKELNWDDYLVMFQPAVPRLEPAFSAIEAAMPDTAPVVDGNPADPPLVPAIAGTSGQAEPEEADIQDSGGISDKPGVVHSPREHTDKGRGDEKGEEDHPTPVGGKSISREEGGGGAPEPEEQEGI